MSRIYLYISPIHQIGKREWRAVVYDANGYLGASAFTDFEWRFPAFLGLDPPSEWKSITDHPRYNSNDGMYAGCPRTLRKLYERYKAEINQALAAGKPKKVACEQPFTVFDEVD